MDFSVLNERQLSAVKETEGYVRVIAGAGTGKTRVLVSRYLYLVTELGIDPDSILCLTFTRKARNEMIERIRNELGPDEELPYILTYHSFGSRFLKEEIKCIGYNSSFRIFDERDTYKVLNKLFDDHGMKLDNLAFEEMKDKITSIKRKEEYIPLMMDHQYEEHILLKRKSIYDDIVDCYLLNQRKGRWLDFDDLIFYSHYILKHHSDIREKWQNMFSYFEVDEAQDTSKIEYEILEMLSCRCKNLFVVGDPDQNIYEWRDSDNRILLDFDKTHTPCKTFILVDNYRSTKNILDVSNRLIANNKNRVKKNLYALKEEGDKVTFEAVDTEYDSARKIAKLIQESVDRKEDYKDNAVLFRCNFYSLTLEKVLKSENIPYEIVGAPSFFELVEIKDIISLIKIIVEEDDESLIRMINKPSRRFGKKKVEYLLSLQTDEPLLSTLKKHRNDIEFVGTDIQLFLDVIERIQINADKWNALKCINRLIEDSGYEDYLAKLKNPSHYENLKAFVNSVSEDIKDDNKIVLKDYYLKHLKRKEQEIENKNTVSLLTIHASKGLEFKNVYIVGLDEPFFPHYKTIEERKDSGLEEERRLLYVALTRAKERLYLFSEKEVSDKNGVSRFVNELFPDEDIPKPVKKTSTKKDNKQKTEKIKPVKVRKPRGVPNLTDLFELKK